MTTLGHTLQNRSRNTWKEWSGKFCPIRHIHSPDIAPSDFHLFRSIQLAFLKNDSILTKKNISKNGLMNRSFQKNQISSFKESVYYLKDGRKLFPMEHTSNEFTLYCYFCLNKYIFFIKKGRKLILNIMRKFSKN